MTDTMNAATRPLAMRKMTSTASPRRMPQRVSMRTAGSRLTAMNRAMSTRISTARVV